MAIFLRRRTFISRALLLTVVAGLLLPSSLKTDAAAPPEVQNAITEKSLELQEISSKIRETQKNLEETQGQRKTLQRELGKIDASINQLTLGIKSSELLLDKLGLEVESLGYDITDIEKSIESKKDAILKTMQEIQEKDDETPLVILLKNQTLTASVFELQTLLDLNTGLEAAVFSLKQARSDLDRNLTDTTQKKNAIAEENKNLRNKKIIIDDAKRDKQTILTQTKNQERLYQKSLTELEKKQADIAAQIESLERELRGTINTGVLPAKRAGVLGMSVAGGALTQEYGATEFARYGYKGKWHNGVDFGAPIGTPVMAAEDGRVVAVGNQDRYCYRGAYGKFIAISHDNNLTTVYAHLSLQSAKEGSVVTRGQIIGYVGRTGYATGPHLHLTVYASPTFRISASKTCGPKMPYGGDLNPLDYL
ncbi:peptidoglycan DD-metalloendopeptidase family protein [Candidatus Wolfebacteria bacterium]|nr:peptidoglycan DD-metalloendopeptidase family protein [Candidatus Wolfebacteria bacterium]